MLVPDPHAASFNNDARLTRFKRLVLCQVMPDVGAIGLDDFFDIVLQVAIHDRVLHPVKPGA